MASRYVLLVEVDAVLVLATSVTTTTRVLTVLADATVTGGGLTALLTMLLKASGLNASGKPSWRGEKGASCGKGIRGGDAPWLGPQRERHRERRNWLEYFSADPPGLCRIARVEIVGTSSARNAAEEAPQQEEQERLAQERRRACAQLAAPPNTLVSQISKEEEALAAVLAPDLVPRCAADSCRLAGNRFMAALRSKRKIAICSLRIVLKRVRTFAAVSSGPH